MNKFSTLAAAVALTFPLASNAATVSVGPGGFDGGFATGITFDDTASRGTTSDRDNPLNALGATDSNFFEIGLGSSVDLTFGTLFDGLASIVEVTFGSRSGFVETADVFASVGGGAFVSIGSISNASATAVIDLSGTGGPFDTLRLTDTTVTTGLSAGGFDVDSVRVSAVPLPAAGFLLIGALGGLFAARRRKN